MVPEVSLAMAGGHGRSRQSGWRVTTLGLQASGQGKRLKGLGVRTSSEPGLGNILKSALGAGARSQC